jgi:hypothetical protein
VGYKAWMALCCRADLVVATGAEGYSREISPPPAGAHVDPLTGRLSVASATAIFLETTCADDAGATGAVATGGGAGGMMTFELFVEGLARCGQALYGGSVASGGGGVGGSSVNQWVHQVVKAHVGPNLLDGIEGGARGSTSTSRR